MESETSDASASLEQTPSDSLSNDVTTHHHEENLLAKSHRGMFLGILIFAGSIISVVLFLFEVGKNKETAELIYLISDITLHAILLIVTVVALIRLQKLNFVAKPASIDDILLLIAMSGSVLFETSMMVAAGADLSNENTKKFIPAILGVFTGLVAGVQSVVQVISIASGMRRYPSQRDHVRNMPGRGSVTCLVVGNVSVWIFRTLQAKNITLHTLQCYYYGKLAWLLLVNISLPLLLFYRFHSSICLADVWHSAYTPLHEKISKDGSSQPPAGFQPLVKRNSIESNNRLRWMGSEGGFGSQLIQAVSYSNISTTHSTHSDKYQRANGAIGFRGYAGGSLSSLRPTEERGNDDVAVEVVQDGFGAHL